MNKDKLSSFIKLCKRDCVANVLLKENFEDFMNSSFDDAYDYFCNKGMIQTESINDITICRWINEEHENNPSISLNGLIGLVMKRSGGRINPNRVKDILVEYLKG